MSRAIYFCGSIRGGRQDAALYADIIRVLGSFGRVLTEHVGKSDFDTNKELQPGVEKDVDIFAKDMGWLAEADVVVAEVTTASTGVGWELGAAWQMKKPILAIFRPAANGPHAISAMVRGAVGQPGFTYREYAGLEDLRPILDAFFAPA